MNQLIEAKQFLMVNDLERATRKLMDFGFERLDYQSDFYNRIFKFREQINISKKSRNLDESNLNNFLKTGSCLIEELEELTLEIQPTKARRDYIKSKNLELIYAKSGKVHFKLGPIDFNLKQGQIIGVVGENGNGKTTLLRILAKLLMPSSGDLNFELDSSIPFDMKREIAFIPQRVPKWNGSLIENLKFHAALNGFTGEENENRVQFIINRLGLSSYQKLKWKELSSGYKLRFELAKILVKRAKILILDEPLANLDLNAQQLFLEDLINFKNSFKEPLSIVLSSQQIHEVEKVADEMIFLKNGEVVFQGDTKNLQSERWFEFELNGDFSLIELKNVLKERNYQIKDLGTGYSISSDSDKDGTLLLRQLVDNDFQIDYFRNISKSTKKYFNQ